MEGFYYIVLEYVIDDVFDIVIYRVIVDYYFER